MKLNFKVLFAALFAVIRLHAAELKYQNYDWEAEPKLHTLDEKDKSQPEVVLFEKQAIEYIYAKTGELEEYKLYHQILRVNTNDAIEKNNRLYIPSGNSLGFLKQKARVISPGGKVTVLSEKDIQEAEDETTKYRFKYFAVSGVEVGCEIEYYYLMKTAVNYSGIGERLQGTCTKHDVSFEIITPANLQFAFKSYNKLPDLQQDTTVTDKNLHFINMKVIPALPEEELSSHYADLMQFEFKLNSNTANNSRDIISYGGVSTSIYKSLMSTVEKGDRSKVKKFIKSMPVAYAKNEEDKIRIIEDYIKNNINILDNNSVELNRLSDILDRKNASKEGIIRLMTAIFNELNIDYQLVITTSRMSIRFDPDFEAYNFLNDYLIYFPSVGSYMAPGLVLSRLGFPPAHLTNTYGLFIKKVSLNDYETGVGKVKFIDPVAFDKNYDNTEATVKFESDMSAPVVQLRREFGGYYAENIQPYYSFFTDEDKKKTTDALLKDFIPNTDIKEISVENAGKDYFPSMPFILKASFTCENLMEKSGTKYVFKIGELIGPQVEMYQKEERKSDIENEYARCYRRKLIFEVPAGYKVSNLEALNINVFCEENGTKTTAFTSTYKLEGNTLTIDIDEYYKKIRFPLSEYENYRSVINASANFNKINLFLDKIN